MALYCTNCRMMSQDGDAVCRNCGNGFVSRLACAVCNRVVPSDMAFCASCPRPSREGGGPSDVPAMIPGPGLPLAIQGSVLSLPPGLSLERAHVPDTYQAGRFGVKAEVQMSGQDADIMTKMNQVAVLLHTLAAEMNRFQAVGESTRRLIRGCRNLATELQEEVELRRGPQDAGPT